MEIAFPFIGTDYYPCSVYAAYFQYSVARDRNIQESLSDKTTCMRR
jgi:hypothetical protein